MEVAHRPSRKHRGKRPWWSLEAGRRAGSFLVATGTRDSRARSPVVCLLGLAESNEIIFPFLFRLPSFPLSSLPYRCCRSCLTIILWPLPALQLPPSTKETGRESERGAQERKRGLLLLVLVEMTSRGPPLRPRPPAKQWGNLLTPPRGATLSCDQLGLLQASPLLSSSLVHLYQHGRRRDEFDVRRSANRSAAVSHVCNSISAPFLRWVRGSGAGEKGCRINVWKEFADRSKLF